MHANTDPIQPEVLHPLPEGTIVRLPDGTVGEVVWSSHAEVRVVHADNVNGRGPWIFARHQVEAASLPEAASYGQRRARARAADLSAPLMIIWI